MGITDDGMTWAAEAARIAAVAVAVINTNAAIEMAEKQEEIAKNYLTIAQEQNQYYYDVYVPCEDAELEEACSAELYEKHTAVQIGRMTNTVRHEFAGAPEKALQCIGRYCTGKQASIIKDGLAAEATALATAANLGRRYEDQFKDAQDDLRWARRSEALNRGRGMMAQTVSFSGFAYGLFGRLQNQAAKGATGAIRYLGYANNRNRTEYPMGVRYQRPTDATMITTPRRSPAPQIQPPAPTLEPAPVVKHRRIMG